MDIPSLIELDRLAKAAGRRHRIRRPLYETLEKDSGRHFIGIRGPRGAGKTILLQQLASRQPDSFYLSLDTLPPETDLFKLLRQLNSQYHFQKFFLDEIHFLSDAAGTLKRIFDFLPIRILFTSSVALRIQESSHDLARRVRIYPLEYFSYREFLLFRHQISLPPLSLRQFLSGPIDPAYLRVADHFEDYLTGGLLPFALEEPDPLPLLQATIETIISRDIPATLRLHTDELDLLRKMLAFVGRSGVDGINYSTLSANLKITKYKAEQYVTAFENAFLLLRLLPIGTNVLKEPKILLIPPLRTLYRPLDEARGGLREDFVALAMRQAQEPVAYLKTTRGQKTPDFLLRHENQSIVLEVGVKGKGRSQFKGITADRKIILAPDAPLTENRKPLHLLGFLS